MMLDRWAEVTSKRLRDQIYNRRRILKSALDSLAGDPEERTGWELLGIAYDGIELDYLETLIDKVDGSKQQRLTALEILGPD